MLLEQSISYRFSETPLNILLPNGHAFMPATILSPLYHLAYRAAQTLRSLYWQVFKPDVFGAKLIVFNDAGEVLLIRHSYGRSDLYMLPGGGIGKNEDPETGAMRELREEVQCHAENVTFLAKFVDNAKGATNTVTVFTATTHDQPVIDGKELIEARFIPPDNLPENVSHATVKRIAEALGKQPVGDHW